MVEQPRCRAYGDHGFNSRTDRTFFLKLKTCYDVFLLTLGFVVALLRAFGAIGERYRLITGRVWVRVPESPLYAPLFLIGEGTTLIRWESGFESQGEYSNVKQLVQV